jgi:hypothetical protein
VLDRGLIAPTAVAGWEEGFGNMLWVADNCGVYRLGAGLQPDKVSSPDLDRLIQAQAKVDPATQSRANRSGRFRGRALPGNSTSKARSGTSA